MIIVQRLREIQSRFGYLPDKELEQLARLLGVPLYRIQEVASFFLSFRQEWDKPAVLEVRVCRDMACHHGGAVQLLDPHAGLARLADDAALHAVLQKVGPRWTQAERDAAAKKGKPIELPDPEPERCRLVVEGVSCLGRCDRAPAVWVERHPMPAGQHAWTYGRGKGESVADYQARLTEALQAMVGNRPPKPNPDEQYEPYTNVGYAAPVRRHTPGEDHDHHALPRSAGWQIDLYHGRDRSYDAVRTVAEYLRGTRGLAPWPSAEELRARYAEEIKKQRAKIDDAVEAALKKLPGLTPEQRADRGKELRQKEEDKLCQEPFIKDANEHLWKLKESGLQGMGGAGMLAYQKWLDVWVATPQDKSVPPAKYIVCNGDESEPGTFKDRELLLRTPHLVVEGMVLAGLMTGATAGYIFIRHEYHEQIHAVEEEIKRAVQLGACGDDIFGSGINFPVAVFESPGGYICGEQSALLEAMEDRRAQPRNRPPELQANGLWDMPTVVNNVETLAWTPFVVVNGGKAYANLGREITQAELPDDLKAKPGDKPRRAGFGGRRLFSISGDLTRPGVYEVPVGLTLRELVTGRDYCNGVTPWPDGRPRGVKAIATSGPSGGLLPGRVPVNPKSRGKYIEAANKLRPDAIPQMRAFIQRALPEGADSFDVLDLPLDLNFFRNVYEVFKMPVEPMLGAGMVVYAEGTDVFDAAVNFSEFFRNESCGKCVPCRVGSQKLVQIGTSLLASRNAGQYDPVAVYGRAGGSGGIHADVREFMSTLQKTSICGLGYVASSPMASALEYFRADVEKKPGG